VLKKVEPHGVTLERMQREPVKNPLADEVLFAGRTFQTPSTRFELIADTPVVSNAGPDAEYPLHFLSLSSKGAQSSQWTDARAKASGTITVHPDTASAAGLAAGDDAVVESRVGAIRARVITDPTQRRDTAVMPKGGWYDEGRCANTLVEARLSDIGEGGALYDTPVRIRKP
jgi:anaerobic selenocysteine-containing dehydrogenase